MISEKEQVIASSLASFRFTNIRITLSNGEEKYVRDCNLKELMTSKHFLEENGITGPSEKVQFLLDNMTHDNDLCGDWKIISEVDKDVSGFYGVAIDVGDNQALMSFEGTNFKHVGDVKENASSLITTSTQQREDCGEYITQLMTDENYKDYKIGFVGHSLGGNLAFHAGVEAAAIDVDRVSLVSNFDGPGNSSEYLRKYDEHFKKLKRAGVEVKLFQWSAVGSMLPPHESVEEIPVDMDEPPSAWDPRDIAARHNNTLNINNFDGNSMKRGGTIGPLQHFARFTTIYLDIRIPSFAVSFVDFFFSITSLSDKERLIYDIALLIAIICLTGLGPEIAGLIIAVLISFLVLGILDLIIKGYNMTVEFTDYIVNYVTEAIIRAMKQLRMALDDLNVIMQGVRDTINELIERAKAALNYGYRYALERTRLVVDTNLLTNYASQVQNIVNRVDRIEERLLRIYRTSISTDFTFFASANRSLIINIGLVSGFDDYRSRFLQIKRYLTRTAQEFEDTEKILKNQWR